MLRIESRWQSSLLARWHSLIAIRPLRRALFDKYRWNASRSKAGRPTSSISAIGCDGPYFGILEVLASRSARAIWALIPRSRVSVPETPAPGFSTFSTGNVSPIWGLLSEKATVP